MTLNQFPALATALMQTNNTTRNIANQSVARVARPQQADIGEYQSQSHLNTGPQNTVNRRVKKDRRRNDRRRTARDRRKTSRSTGSGAARTPGRSSQPAHQRSAWKQAVTEAQQVPAAPAPALRTPRPVDEMVELLREESLYLQKMLIEHTHNSGSASRESLIITSRLEEIQQILQHKIESEAQKLKHQCSVAERCGNLIDEHS